MSSSVSSFLKSHYGSASEKSLIPLAKSGSSRRYYRFSYENKTYILTESDNVEENKTFLYFTEHFSKIILNLPEIKLISDDMQIYVQSDLGDTSLMSLLESDRSSAKEFFVKSIEQLVKMQVSGDENLDYSKCFSYPDFNYLLTLRDLFSFKNYFLNLTGIEYNQGKLLKDFENFSNNFEKIPDRYFVFRDFQSRNIMIHNDRPYFIDYQGGMRGPVQYDLVSLIWQARANLSEEWKEEFYDIYIKSYIDTTGKDLDGFEFRKGYELCLIERLLQVLGTYGLRGIYERKPHFQKSIKFALKNLKEIEGLELLNEYPELQKMIQKLSEPKVYSDLKTKIDE